MGKDVNKKAWGDVKEQSKVFRLSCSEMSYSRCIRKEDRIAIETVKTVSFDVGGRMEMVKVEEDIAEVDCLKHFIKGFLVSLVWIEVSGE